MNAIRGAIDLLLTPVDTTVGYVSEMRMMTGIYGDARDLLWEWAEAPATEGPKRAMVAWRQFLIDAVDYTIINKDYPSYDEEEAEATFNAALEKGTITKQLNAALRSLERAQRADKAPCFTLTLDTPSGDEVEYTSWIEEQAEHALEFWLREIADERPKKTWKKFFADVKKRSREIEYECASSPRRR